MAKTGMRAVRSVAIWFTSLGLFTWACGDSAKDVKGGLGGLCAKDGDCQASLACAFGTCHKTCKDASVCGVGLLCVNGPTSGVCQLPSEAVCSQTQACPIGQKCSADGQCRDSCDSGNSCSNGLICSAFKLCERPDDVGTGGTPSTQPGEGGESGRADGGSAGSVPVGSGGASGAGGGEPTGGVTAEGGAPVGSGGDTSATGGDAGAGGVGPLVSGESCDSDDRGNDADSAHVALPGVRVQSCLQVKSDVDFFEFTAPAAPQQGGYFVLSATDVAASAALRMTLESAAGGSALGTWYGEPGESVFAWVAAAPGASFRVAVSGESWAGAANFVFRARYAGVRDDFAPNGTVEEAKPIDVDNSIQGYAFGGYNGPTAPEATDFDDFFAVHLNAGKLKARLSPPADGRAEIRLLDKNGEEVAGGRVFHGLEGQPIELIMSKIVEGDYILRVMLFGDMPESVGGGARPAPHVTDPYTFTVMQP
ncbi:MAG TPA: hypothetical protein VFQ61_04280 [Polyangiaceae bacterium]|nr:hypothetical protein [Polyangiaceae bacterium]